MEARLGLVVKTPSETSNSEFEEFIALVLSAREVDPVGLPNRIRSASLLAFDRSETGILKAVGGLKVPSDDYRNRVARASGFELDRIGIPFELGWLSVGERFRRRGLAKGISNVLMARACSSIFATVRLTNLPSIGLLEAVGFRKVGHPYDSKNGYELVLMLRDALANS